MKITPSRFSEWVEFLHLKKLTNLMFLVEVFKQIQVSFGTHLSHLGRFVLIHWQATSSQLLLSFFMARYSCISISSNLVWGDLRCLQPIPKPKSNHSHYRTDGKENSGGKMMRPLPVTADFAEKWARWKLFFTQAPVHQFSDVRSRSSRTFVACCPLTGTINRKNNGLWIEGNLRSIGSIPIWKHSLAAKSRRGPVQVQYL